MTSQYTNPTNADQVETEIRSAKTLGEVKDITERVFPGFIRGFSSEFSSDYPLFTYNWKKICDMTGVLPTQIMVTGGWNPDTPETTLLRDISECFTKAGFFVRCDTELKPCIVCRKMLPTESYYDMLKNHGATRIPPRWSPACTGCYDKLVASAK